MIPEIEKLAHSEARPSLINRRLSAESSKPHHLTNYESPNYRPMASQRVEKTPKHRIMAKGMLIRANPEISPPDSSTATPLHQAVVRMLSGSTSYADWSL